jgi:Flp pilus assembly protein TadG
MNLAGARRTGATKMNLRCRKGAELVEFALILPILLMLVFGVIDFGLATFDKAVITNAAREGARVGIVYRSPAANGAALQGIVTTAVNNYCSTYLVTFGGATAPIVTVTGGGASGASLSVRVQYQYGYLAMAGLLGFAPLNLSSTTVMRME